MSIDEHRMLTDLLDAFDRLHDGMIEPTDVAALLYAASRALADWPHAGELAAAEKELRRIAQDRRGGASDLLQPLRERIAGELAAVTRRPRHRRDGSGSD